MTRAAIVIGTLALSGAVAAGQPVYFSAGEEGLPVHASPGGPKIGELAPGARPIEASGVDAGGLWARIQYGEGDGWIEVDRAGEAEPALLEIAAIPQGLVCGGTEPFWSLRFSEEKANFVEPGAEAVAFELSRPAVAAGSAGWPLSVTLVGGEASGVALLRPALCADGMSDRTYPWTLDLLTQREGAPLLLTGCCRLPIAP